MTKAAEAPQVSAGIPWGWIVAYLVLATLGHFAGRNFLQSSAVSLFFFPAGFTLAFLLTVGPKWAPLTVLPHLFAVAVPYHGVFFPGLVLGLFHAQTYGLMA